MKPKLLKKSRRMALEALETDQTLAVIGERYGVTRQRVNQNLRRFCKHFCHRYEAYDSAGKMKNLKDLRAVWRKNRAV